MDIHGHSCSTLIAQYDGWHSKKQTRSSIAISWVVVAQSTVKPTKTNKRQRWDMMPYDPSFTTQTAHTTPHNLLSLWHVKSMVTFLSSRPCSAQFRHAILVIFIDYSHDDLIHITHSADKKRGVSCPWSPHLAVFSFSLVALLLMRKINHISRHFFSRGAQRFSWFVCLCFAFHGQSDVVTNKHGSW